MVYTSLELHRCAHHHLPPNHHHQSHHHHHHHHHHRERNGDFFSNASNPTIHQPIRQNITTFRHHQHQSPCINNNYSTSSSSIPNVLAPLSGPRRKGGWLPEEETFTVAIINYFKEGLLVIREGTMLRRYLAQKLNCEPMRITKKFKGTQSIGRQRYRPSPDSNLLMSKRMAAKELSYLEAAFRNAVAQEHLCPTLTEMQLRNSTHKISPSLVTKIGTAERVRVPSSLETSIDSMAEKKDKILTVAKKYAVEHSSSIDYDDLVGAGTLLMGFMKQTTSPSNSSARVSYSFSNSTSDQSDLSSDSLSDVSSETSCGSAASE